jgi:hypothetical protein
LATAGRNLQEVQGAEEALQLTLLGVAGVAVHRHRQGVEVEVELKDQSAQAVAVEEAIQEHQSFLQVVVAAAAEKVRQARKLEVEGAGAIEGLHEQGVGVEVLLVDRDPS